MFFQNHQINIPHDFTGLERLIPPEFGVEAFNK